MNVHLENMIVVIIFSALTIMVDTGVIVQEVTEKACPNDTASVSDAALCYPLNKSCKWL